MNRERHTSADDATVASKGSRTRQRLLDATATEVALRGAAGANINTIAQAAGLKTGSIYFHYQSKDRLIDAMLEEGFVRSLSLLDAAMAALPAGSGGTARLVAAIHAHAKAVSSLRDYTVAISAPNLPQDTMGAVARKLRARYGSLWTQLVTEAQHCQALPSGPSPQLLRDLIFGALNAVSLGRNSPHQAANALTALIVVRPGDA